MMTIDSEQRNTFRISNCRRALCFSLLIIISTISVSSSRMTQASQPRKSVSLPRNYCSVDIASLGTGLVRVPIQSGTEKLTNKSVKWSGWLRAAATGKYEFSLPDNDVSIFVNQQQIFSRSAMSPKPTVIQIELLANRFYAISVETLNNGNTDLQLKWRRPDGRRETIPKAYLYAPLATTSNSETA